MNKNIELDNLSRKIEKLIQNKEFDEAENIVKNTINNNEFLDTMYYSLGVIKLRSGSPKESRKFFDKSYELNRNLHEALLSKGISYLQERNYIKCIEIIKSYLKIYPKNLNALNILSDCFYTQKDYLNAQKNYKKSLKIDKNQPLVYLRLANIYSELDNFEKSNLLYIQLLEKTDKYNLSEQNRINIFINYSKLLIKFKKIDETINLYQRALKQFPNNNNIVNSYVSFLIIKRDFEIAKNYLDFLYKNSPKEPETIINHAHYYYETSNFEESKNFYEKALELDKENYVLLNNLSSVNIELDNYMEAIDYSKKSIKNNPQYFNAYNNLSRCYFFLGDIDNALIYAERALEINPLESMVSNNIGNCYQAKGDLKKAESFFSKALLLDKNCADSFLSLSYLKKIESKDFINNAIEIVNKNKLKKKDLGSFCFGLYKFYEKERQYDLAFNYLNKANEYYFDISKIKKYPKKSYFKSLRKITEQKKEIYSLNNISLLSNGGCVSDQPIFIVGMQRSGTTLLEQILSSHKEVSGAGELPFIGNIKNQYNISEDFFYSKNTSLESNFLNIFTQKKRKELGDIYIDKSFDYLNKGTNYIVDKMPANYMNIGFILSILPNAKIINIQKDILDNCFSLYAVKFEKGHEFSYNMDYIIETYKNYIEIISHWNTIYPNKIYHINYEDLVKNTEDEVRKTLDFCNLEFDKNCLNFYENKKYVLTASSGQIRDKINSKSIGRWKNYNKYLEKYFQNIGSYD